MAENQQVKGALIGAVGAPEQESALKTLNMLPLASAIFITFVREFYLLRILCTPIFDKEPTMDAKSLSGLIWPYSAGMSGEK